MLIFNLFTAKYSFDYDKRKLRKILKRGIYEKFSPFFSQLNYCSIDYSLDHGVCKSVDSQNKFYVFIS